MKAYSQDKSRPLLYDLAGAIMHKGLFLREGHYIAFAIYLGKGFVMSLSQDLCVSLHDCQGQWQMVVI